MNLALAKAHNVQVKGVILNSVFPSKKHKIVEYVSKALKEWNIPLLACIPYNSYLNAISMNDVKNTLDSDLISRPFNREVRQIV